MLLVDWWISLEPAQQVFWSIALVSSVLLSILTVVNIFAWEADHEPASGTREKRGLLTDPRTVLIAFTCFGWIAVLTFYFSQDIVVVLLIAAAGAMVGALVPWFVAPFFSRPVFDADDALKSTGQVLTSVPPHRNGFGKVHINMRAAPYSIDAVTAGGELLPGAPVRIVEVIDERVVLVEPLEEPGRPGLDKKENPPPPGRRRTSNPRK